MSRVGKVVVVVACVAMVLLVAPSAGAANSLTLTPNHGPAGVAFTASFFSQNGPECFNGGATVTFHWDSPTNPAYASATMNGVSCTGSATAPSPSGAPLGSHTVYARMCTTPFVPCQQASAGYTIEPAPPTTTTTTTSTTSTTTTTTTMPPVLPPKLPEPAPTTAPTTTPTTTSLAATTTTITAPPALAPSQSADTGGSGGGFIASTPGPEKVKSSLGVIFTNLMLTLLLLLIFGVTSAVFNSTLESNREAIEGWWQGVRGRVARWGSWFTGSLPVAARVGVLLVLTGGVYGFLSPGFGLNRASAVLFVSLMAGLGVLTLVGEGGAAWFARRRLGLPAAVRVHTVALFAAIGCVIVTRALEFEPGIVYGFVASTAILVPQALDRAQSGRSAFYPALALLGLGIVAWFGLGVVRSGGGEGWGSDLAEGVLAVLFVGGIEGVMYNMVPLTFMDGRSIVEWNRAAWLVLFGVSTYLFFHLLINPHGEYGDAFGETGVVVVLALAAAYATVTAITWSYFRFRGAQVATSG